VGVSPE
jgi:chromosome segregation ATPase